MTGEGARARNVSLNESLGKVSHAFCDKTGTLTQNEMHLRLLSIRDTMLGVVDNRLETLTNPPVGEAARLAFDPRLQQAVAALQREMRRLRCNVWDLLDASDGRSPPHDHEPDSDSSTSSAELGPSIHTDGDPLKTGVDLLHFFLSLVVGHELLVEAAAEASEGPGIDLSPASAATEAPNARPPVGPMEHSSHAPSPGNGRGKKKEAERPGNGTAPPVEESKPQGQGSPAKPGRPHPWKSVPVYTGPSPDEVALVTGCAVLGFRFLGRTSEGIEVEILGQRGFIEILDVLEFTGERRRMSVIARLPQGGSIWLFMKGADVTVTERILTEGGPDLEEAHKLASQLYNQLGAKAVGGSVLTETLVHLHRMSTLGLRTLVVAGKRLDAHEYAAWSAEFKLASSSLKDRKARKETLADLLERDLTLYGVVGVEDKLQEGVPWAIRTLLEAGIRVWMITGVRENCSAVATPSAQEKTQPSKPLPPTSSNSPPPSLPGQT